MRTSRTVWSYYLLVAALLLIAGCEHDKKNATTKPALDAKHAADKVPATGDPAEKKTADQKTADQKTAAKEPTTSLYERLGGEKSIKAIVNDFVARAANDEKVNFTRKGTGHEWAATPENVDKLKVRLTQFFCVIAGGPQKYEGKDMSDTHKGMQITDAEFDAIAGDLRSSLEKLSVPAREQKELMEIVASTRGVIVAAPPASPVAP
jgi:hemoglobin